MRVDRGLVRADAVAVGAVGDGHDVDVVELGSAFAPVAVGEDVVPADLAARLDLAPGRDGPVDERVEAGDALAGRGRLDVLEEGGEAADDLALVQAFGDLEKDRQEQKIVIVRVIQQQRDGHATDISAQRNNPFVLAETPMKKHLKRAAGHNGQ